MKKLNLRRQLRFETLCARLPLTASGWELGEDETHQIETPKEYRWHNQTMPEDVNRNSSVSPADALIVVNDLNRHGARKFIESEVLENDIDVNHDGRLSPIDALVVVNTLNSQSRIDSTQRPIEKEVDSRTVQVATPDSDITGSTWSTVIDDSNADLIETDDLLHVEEDHSTDVRDDLQLQPDSEHADAMKIPGLGTDSDKSSNEVSENHVDGVDLAENDLVQHAEREHTEREHTESEHTESEHTESEHAESEHAESEHAHSESDHELEHIDEHAEDQAVEENNEGHISTIDSDHIAGATAPLTNEAVERIIKSLPHVEDPLSDGRTSTEDSDDLRSSSTSLIERELKASLTGSGTGKAEFELEGNETKFSIEIRAAANTIYVVRIDGVTAGEIRTNSRGKGKLKFGIGDGDDHESSFPANFPAISRGTRIDVGGGLAGTFAEIAHESGDDD